MYNEQILGLVSPYSLYMDQANRDTYTISSVLVHIKRDTGESDSKFLKRAEEKLAAEFLKFKESYKHEDEKNTRREPLYP